MFYVAFCIALSVVYYLNVNFSSLMNSVGEERAGFSDIDYSYFCCLFSKEFLFVLGKGCVILLWNFLGLPYNYMALI